MSNYFPLSDLKVGSQAIVAKLETQDEGIIRHLMAMGVIQGVNISLESKFPSYVLSVGKSRTALDKETASIIYVSQD
ncbi:FeoA family protein [Cyanobacterium aponinum UTEX 3222]|uniref:FeoA family protein n=2 Tax=Cyanobacterium aponinum TaxID=379064 RepID=K9Z7M1_CYAAP|nr:FeoA family protein [Cyanobacterium aponinum]WRL42867.1 FeoA family protein [Cyanobacterium aponinum UTEX 3222]AFZ55149.1 FeoA family protein [Cyanobacterium aponinum PCC 10605]MBD2394946.1 ferrous iron transport protein A [Cyanobacterium aponinum FACHB-4101]PHV61235.1 ferrous iron transport protein A [Cyanobacterium aponinum IPPAS B-1201]WPF88297.1 FeoA family protein [Cyanobacterium aponinum AL20115]